jgi:hypothetical protein
MINLINKLIRTFFNISFLFNTESFPLTQQIDIQDVIFKHNYIYFIEDKYIRIFNIEKRSFLLPIEKPYQSTVSIKNNILLFCEWENFNIDSLDEYSTKVFIYEKDDKDNALILNLHPTVKPTNCSKDILLLTTSLPQLEKRNFTYTFESEKLEEIAVYKEELVDTWTNNYKNITVKKGIDNVIWIYRKVFLF